MAVANAFAALVEKLEETFFALGEPVADQLVRWLKK